VLWPYWFATHPNGVEWIRRGLRVALIGALVWSIWQLLNVPEPEER
jgi:ABC-type cobalamin transport system permease subunit